MTDADILDAESRIVEIRDLYRVTVSAWWGEFTTGYHATPESAETAAIFNALKHCAFEGVSFYPTIRRVIVVDGIIAGSNGQRIIS